MSGPALVLLLLAVVFAAAVLELHAARRAARQRRQYDVPPVPASSLRTLEEGDEL